MKMLISDYDGTLNKNEDYILKIDLKLNIDAIKEFRRKGNIFVISTTRSYDSIKEEIYKYKIPYDFLTCNNGSVIFDYKDNVIYKNILSCNDLHKISDVLNGYDITYIDIYGKQVSIIDPDIVYASIKEFWKYKKIKQELNDYKVVLRNLNIFIKNSSTKLDGANILKEYLATNEIYAVGDSKDELELLQAYDGYKMLMSDPCLYNKNIKTTSSVHKVIKKIKKI